MEQRFRFVNTFGRQAVERSVDASGNGRERCDQQTDHPSAGNGNEEGGYDRCHRAGDKPSFHPTPPAPCRQDGFNLGLIGGKHHPHGAYFGPDSPDFLRVHFVDGGRVAAAGQNERTDQQ